MRFLFYVGAIGLILFEIANVYLIMPMPGSQRAATIDLAYFLYTWRWGFRVILGLCIAIGFLKAFRAQRILTVIALLLTCAVIYVFNFKMKAEKMFLQPETLRMQTASENRIPAGKLILGYVCDGDARAYPIQLIAYHHQVLDTVCGEAMMVTYCSVCRSGRIFKPEIDGKPAAFRLVGMDHFNAMFEDNLTRSWWRQENGEAITGKLKGKTLPELTSEQMTLAQWLSIYPGSKIMQYDPVFQEQYDSLDTYDSGIGRGKLTGTDTLSWNDKSWVVGVVVGNAEKVYDWNQLKKARIIHDVIGDIPVILVIAADNQNFVAFECPTPSAQFSIRHDTLQWEQHTYDLAGRALSSGDTALRKIQAYQEFWHSWKTFHPDTEVR